MHVITLTPTETGEFSVVCNEYCGIGHHTMVGRIRVVD
jgi:cytochrome c oxidase subunit II